LASAYATIQVEGCQHFSFYKIIWKSDDPLKCCILSLFGGHGEMSRGGQTWSRGTALVGLLAMGVAAEDDVHLLAACPVAASVWSWALQGSNLPAAMAPLTSTSSLLDWWMAG
jgi:hypothetical protein